MKLCQSHQIHGGSRIVLGGQSWSVSSQSAPEDGPRQIAGGIDLAVASSK
jgi:hypothetical protein